MKLYTVNSGYFKLDGGAMFGVVPKSVWSRTNPADQNNMCNWAMRCLLVETDGRLILIDNGLGDKQNCEALDVGDYSTPFGEDLRQRGEVAVQQRELSNGPCGAASGSHCDADIGLLEGNTKFRKA